MNKKLILLIDDNPMQHQLMALFLKKESIQLESAYSGPQALFLFEKMPFNFIFMDCHMPEMDGFETTAKIREIEQQLGIHTPISAFTSDNDRSIARKCKEYGMDDYLLKPASRQQVMETINRWCTLELDTNRNEAVSRPC